MYVAENKKLIKLPKQSKQSTSRTVFKSKKKSKDQSNCVITIDKNIKNLYSGNIQGVILENFTGY